MRPAWLEDELNETGDMSAGHARKLLSLVETLAGALGRMHSGYMHDPQCIACDALARYAEGPK